MSLEIASNKCVSFAVDSLDVFQPSRTRGLLGKDAVKLWVDAVGVEHDGNEFARRDLDRARRHLGQRVADRLHHLVHMAVDDSRDQRLLAREVLIERADADARYGAAILLVLALSYPSFIKTRAVASSSASTVRRDRS